MSLDNLRHAQYTGDGTQIDDPQPVEMAAVTTINPTGSAQGDYDNFQEAMLVATGAGGGRVVYTPGNYISKLLTGSETRRLVEGVYLHAPGGATITCAVDAAVNRSNIFEANGVDNWVIDGFTLDGNRQTNQQVLITDTDAVDNCVRLVNTSGWELRNCVLKNARQHGLIGVQRINDFRIANVHTTGNGWRGAHIHDENNQAGRRGIIENIRCWRNGRSGYQGYNALGSITNGSAVIQLPAGGGAAMALIFGNSGTNTLLRLSGAGTGGGDIFTYVTAVNSGANQITIAENALITKAGVPVVVMGDDNTGLFVVFGGEELVLSNVQIWQEPGLGLALVGYRDAAWTRLGQYFVNIMPDALSTVCMASADYTAFKAAYNALSAPNKLLASVTIDQSGTGSKDTVSGIGIFTDATTSFTLLTPASQAVRGVRMDAAYQVNTGTGLRKPASSIMLSNIAINNCGVGVLAQQLNGVGMHNTHILNSVFEGMRLYSTQNFTFGETSRIVNSGRLGVEMIAQGDTGQPSSVIDSVNNVFNGKFSGAGASVLRISNGTASKVTNTVFGPSSVVEGGGSNPHARLGGFYSGRGVFVSNDGGGVCETPKFYGEIARNVLGGVKLAITNGRGGAYPGARIYDNVDPSAVSVPTAAGKGAPAFELTGAGTTIELNGVDFNCRDRINDSFTIDLSTGTGHRVVFCKLELETRNGGGGNVAFGSATTTHFGNLLHGTAIWSGTGTTTVVAV